MQPHSRVYVAGHRGLVGSALISALERSVALPMYSPAHMLSSIWKSRPPYHDFFHSTQPEYVFLAAAKVGGILANEVCPADFIHSNLQIQSHVIEASRRSPE